MASIEVSILGQKYTIKGEASASQMKELTRFLNEKIREVGETYPNISQTNTLILAALSIAEDLEKVKSENEEMVRQAEAKAETLTGLCD